MQILTYVETKHATNLSDGRDKLRLHSEQPVVGFDYGTGNIPIKYVDIEILQSE